MSNLQESPKSGSEGGRLNHNNKVEQVVMDSKYRDLIKVINLQRDKLNNQQVELTKVGRGRTCEISIFYALFYFLCLDSL